MRKRTRKQWVAMLMSLMMSVVVLDGMNVSAASATKTSNVQKTMTAKKTRKPVTKTNKCTMRLKKKTMWIGPNKAGTHPQTGSWKSSNTKIATVATKGDREGGHKVTAKKKGKVTISCKVTKTYGSWVKGDTYKWVITIK